MDKPPHQIAYVPPLAGLTEQLQQIVANAGKALESAGLLNEVAAAARQVVIAHGSALAYDTDEAWTEVAQKVDDLHSAIRQLDLRHGIDPEDYLNAAPLPAWRSSRLPGVPPA